MKAYFKCKLSGTVVSFEHEHDIKDMRQHPGYDEVVEQPIEPISSTPASKKTISTKKSISTTVGE